MEREEPTPRIPVATYRLQFNPQFGFAAATALLPYLKLLGISDIYASPYFAAKKGSSHGYDIVDHGTLNPELGAEEEYLALCRELARLEMGQILDFVPNHMCIESGNAWWMDLLENGPSSPFASFFDVDWEPVKKELTGKVLLPILGDQYGTVLERGELTLAFEEGAFRMHYYDRVIPIEPVSSLQIMRHRLETLDEVLPPDSPARQEYLSIITALQHLPPTGEQDPERRAERCREKEIVKKRLKKLCAESGEIGRLLLDNVRIFNGEKGEPASFDLLDALLREQPYRLSYWQVATEEINYRRFFDINALAAIRMEDDAVFRTTHQLLFRLVREGKVTGLRLDHLDGLYDPASYLRRLQRGCYVQLRLAEAPPPEGAPPEAEAEPVARLEQEFDLRVAEDPRYRPFYVVGEKILLKGERPPEDWLLMSTTGYDFANAVNGVFVESSAAKDFDRVYGRFVKHPLPFAEVSYESKKLVMQAAMSGEINTMGHHLNTISERDRLTRDFTRNILTRAITEVIACFPVYRTYTTSAPVREKDAQYIEAALAKARRKNPALSSAVFDFLRNVLLLRFPPYAGEGDRLEWLHFVMKFQQITSPVMAKGVEDTAFYLYNRLVSLNEVGGTPERFGMGVDAFHGQNLDRQRSAPFAMIASSTHDSKHGGDFRARINVLSEIPDLWQKALARWSRINKGRKTMLEGQLVPDRNEEYLLYQTLLGAWPAGREGAGAPFRERIREYLVKALREAKVSSSWISPNLPYEEAVDSFIVRILEPTRTNPFLRAFAPLQRLVAHLGIFNSLSQTLLKMTAPGIPDFYQGSELWELTLVDPDNRRPTDYRLRRETLEALVAREAEVGPLRVLRELLESREDGRIKLYLIYRVLTFRGTHRLLFEEGDYLPLEGSGELARHLVAFARRRQGEELVVAVPRLVAALAPEPGTAPLGEPVWGNAVLVLPGQGARSYRDVITGERVEARREGEGAALPLAELFAAAPVALLTSAPESPGRVGGQ